MATRTFTASDAHFLSYPGSGRNWMTLLLGKALHPGCQDPGKLLSLEGFASPSPGVPRTWFSHDDRPHLETVAQIRKDGKGRYQACKVVLVARDPRDAVTSAYHKQRHNPKFYHFGATGRFEGALGEYLRHKRHGIEGAVAWLNVWAERRDVPAGFLLVRYEDMKRDAAGELGRVLRFLGIPYKPETPREAAVFASFDNVRAAEVAGLLHTGRQRGEDRSLLTRRGEVGGHVEALSPADLVYAAETVAELDPLYGYEAEAW